MPSVIFNIPLNFVVKESIISSNLKKGSVTWHCCSPTLLNETIMLLQRGICQFREECGHLKRPKCVKTMALNVRR